MVSSKGQDHLLPRRLPEGRGTQAPSVPGGKKPGWGGFCSQVCSSQGRGRTHCSILAHQSHTTSSACFIDSVGWVSVNWGPDLVAVSWRWVPAVHEGRAADWGC